MDDPSAVYAVYVVYAMVCAFVCLSLAGNKNRSGWWFLGGAVLGVIGIVVLAVLPPLSEDGLPMVATVPATDIAGSLARLADLHRQGALTPEEFETAKRRVLQP